MGLGDILKSIGQTIVPRTRREKGYVAAGIATVALVLGSYGGYRAIEGKYPHILKRYIGNGAMNVDECGELKKSIKNVQFDDLPLEEIVEQIIFTTYTRTNGAESGFRYLTPADTSSYEKGEVVPLKEQTQKRVCENKKTQGGIPVFVGDEGEGGYVTRLELGLPPAEVLGKYYEGKVEESMKRYGSLFDAKGELPVKEQRVVRIGQLFGTAARVLKDSKVDYVFGPVLDVVKDVDATDNLMSAHDRAYSSDADTVIALAMMYIEAMHGQQIKVIGKHYFGTGYTTVDPHKGLPTLGSLSVEERENVEKPFRALATQLDGIMVTHILGHSSQIPDSVNSEAYRYIREGLGYKGLVITDDLDMGAIEERYSDAKNWVVDASLDALVAGADGIIIKYPEDVAQIKNVVMEKMKSDMAFRTAMKERFLRLMKFKGLQIGEPVEVEKVLAGETDTEKGITWLKRRMGQGEYLLGVFAGEDGMVAGYNSNEKLYVKDQRKYDQLVAEFIEKNGVGPGRLRSGTVYFFPDLNSDGAITYGTPEQEEEDRLEKVKKIQGRFASGGTYREYLAGELGQKELVDGEGDLLPVRRGTLKTYTQQFFDDNEDVRRIDRVVAGRVYVFRDYNGDGKITFRDPQE